MSCNISLISISNSAAIMEDVEGIEANMASIKLQETKENASQQGKDELLIRVGGTKFLLDRAIIDLFQSEFLDKLIDPETNFKKPEDGVYNVEANEESFSVFLHMIRYGSLPACMILDKEKESTLLQEACFWGIEGKVQEKIRETKTKLTIPRHQFDKVAYISIKLKESKVHHNFRKDDGYRVLCTECGSRDKDDRLVVFSGSRLYTNCRRCKKGVYYKPDLGWCHKCSLCTECQEKFKPECPADCQISCYYSRIASSTAELEEELQERLKPSFTFMG
jgi:hypothetical protein